MMEQVFISRFTDLVNKSKTEEAIQLMKENPELTNNLSCIIPAIVPNLDSFMSQNRKARFNCSSDILKFITENYQSMTVIKELSRHLKSSRNHVNFCTILNALSSCLMRTAGKRSLADTNMAINWCLESILIYIRHLPLPDEFDDDSEAATDRILCIYKAIIVFLKPLVQEAIDIDSEQEKELLEDPLLSFLIFLCGKPLCCLNKYISEEICEHMKIYQELMDTIVTQALCLSGDILYFLDVVSKRHTKHRKINTEAVHINKLCQAHFTSSMAYANFYFHVITKEHYWANVPQVYSPSYILEMCAYLFETLLSVDYSIPNGLIFMESVIKRISLCSVKREVLKLEIYMELFQPIIKVMIFSDNDEQRKKALRVFQDYIYIFNMEARYAIMSHLYNIVEHSSLLSFLTSMFKSFIIECLDSTPQNPQFLGSKMRSLLKKVCFLPHGSSSDVVEISDEIITMLNLLRFLFIRDTNNESGIWDMKDMLMETYLKPLRDAIDMLKAHWRVKAKDLEEQKKNFIKEQDYEKLMRANMEVTLTVGGKQLPFMPISEKLDICYQAINGLDVMESILIRVNECIDMN